MIERFLPELLGWTSFDIAWSQRYAVTTLCRMLYTLDIGAVTSKPAALEWATRALPSPWHDLIQQVLGDRAIGWDPPTTRRDQEAWRRRLHFPSTRKERAADPHP